jgi:hypothetical protein
MATSALAGLAAKYKALPRNQQQAVLYGVPAAALCLFGYLSWQVMGQLGADPNIHPLLRREGMGKWAEISELDNQIAEKDKVIARKPEIVKRLNELQDDITDAEQRLPREAEKAQMREVIERLAREISSDLGAVKLKSVRIIEETPSGVPAASSQPRLSTVLYQVEIVGDLNGLIKYIDNIEKNTRFMSVNQISLRPGGVKVDPQSKGKISLEPHSVKMDLVTYVYYPGKARAKL